MRLIQSILTKSDCYRAGRKIRIKGLTLHSVGVQQPNAAVFIRNWNKPGVAKGAHAFAEANGNVYQTLPWNHRGWHVGGSANNTHIGVEMTEPAQIKYSGGGGRFTYYAKDRAAVQAHVRGTYNTAVELFAYLCKEYGLNPLGRNVIISHKEANRLGWGSNHGDPEHLWNQTGVGFTMNGFRNDVSKKMKGGFVKPETGGTTTPGNIWYGVGSKHNTKAGVQKLQRDLVRLGFSVGSWGTNGVMGKDTAAAIRDFQKKYGLEQDGQAGPATLARIEKELKNSKPTPTPKPTPKPTPVAPKWFGIGSKYNNKKEVQKLQKDLVRLGFSVGSWGANGVMGNDTAGAIKNFQRKYGLTVDGQAGPATLKRIEQELNKQTQKPQIQVDGLLGPATIRAIQRKVGTPVDGVISKPSTMVRKLQAVAGAKVDGYWGANTTRALQKYFGTPIDGVISRPSTLIKAMQRWANR